MGWFWGESTDFMFGRYDIRVCDRVFVLGIEREDETERN